MDVRYPKYVAGVLLLATLMASACSDTDAASPASPTTAPAASLTAEPERVAAELLPGGSCSNFPGFRTRFTLVVGAGELLTVRGLRFSMLDRFGNRAVPIAIAAGLLSAAATFPSGGPIQLPVSTPIPIPTSGPNNGLSLLPHGSQRFPLTLEFGCNVRSAGTLTVDVDTTDRRGLSRTSRLSLPIGD